MTTMLPHIRLANKIKRIDQISKLYHQIGIDNPIRIDIDKILQPIESVHLGWVLAICRMDYQLFKDVDFDSLALDSMAYLFISKINEIVDDPTKHLGIPKCFDDYDFPTLTQLNQVNSYLIEPGIIIEHILNRPEFSKFTVSLYKEASLEDKKPNVQPNLIPFAEPTEIPNLQDSKNKKNELVKKQILVKLKNDNNRPSDSCRDKSLRIVQELEEIIMNEILDLNSINLDTLWKTAIKQAKEGKSSRFKSGNNQLIDKETSDVWTSGLVYKYKKKIIDWVKQST